MKFTPDLQEGIILKRYKRFLADVQLKDSDQIITMHLPNTGSMITCWDEGWPVLYSTSDNPKRKYAHTVEMIHNGKTWIGVNTSLANKIVFEGLRSKVVSSLSHYNIIKPEKKIYDSRLDFHLSNEKGQECFVEVKNVTLLHEDKAKFPDAVTARGLKHLQLLNKLHQAGHHCVMLYLISREDITHFEPAWHIDPTYSKKLSEINKAGIEILAYQCKLSPKEIILDNALEIKL